MSEKNVQSTTIKGKLVVYTALFGDYDNLIDPIERFEGCDFICFTDQKDLKSEVWDIRLIEECHLPSNMMNRYYKIMPHCFFSDYDFSLYVDSNVSILKSPYYLKDRYLCDSSFAMPKHFLRSNIYDEAGVLLRSGRVTPKKLFKQMLYYKKDGYDGGNSLGENNILLRRHNELGLVMELWWANINKFTQRDQLSLMYILWKTKTNFSFLDESSRDNKFFSLKSHKKMSTSPKSKVLLFFVVFSVPYYALKFLFLNRK